MLAISLIVATALRCWVIPMAQQMMVREEEANRSARCSISEPRVLASAPDGSKVLATTDQGLLSSTDGGRTWAPLASAPPLFLTAWADSKTIVGVTTQGNIAVSANAGQTWKTDLATVTSGQALSADRDKAGVLEILVVTDKGVLQSRDDGATLSELKS